MSSFSADRPEIPRQPGDISGPQPTEGVPQTRQMPVFKIVLRSDPSQDLVHVVRSVMQITRFPREEATHKMWQAHNCGQAVLLITYFERAELLAELLKEKGLTVMLEPA